MKPYGSKRSFDTEPRIKSARALVKREGEALVEEQVTAEVHPREVLEPGEEPCVLCEGTGWLDAFTECDLCEGGGLMKHWKLPSGPHDCTRGGHSFGHGEACVYCGEPA